MSGVYINMEMPKSCLCELLGVGYDLICSFVGGIPCRLKEYYECCQNGTRPSWCPLVPVPPHGRLGDLDALHKLFLEKAKEYKGIGGAMVAMAALCIANAPTIIPAEEGE